MDSLWYCRGPEALLPGRMTRLVDAGQLKVVIDQLYPFEQAVLTFSPGGTWTRARQGRPLDRLKLEKRKVRRRRETMSTEAQAIARRPVISSLGLICAAQFVLQLDFSIVNVALPTIQRELGFVPADLQWVVTGYALTFGSLLHPTGPTTGKQYAARYAVRCHLLSSDFRFRPRYTLFSLQHCDAFSTKEE
ncbi:MAG TPA: hypothetical protein VF026_17540 [Ktedonobacteraceae bacterium]